MTTNPLTETTDSKPQCVVPCTHWLGDMHGEVQSELYPDTCRASGRSLDFGHVGVADFVRWYQHRAEKEDPGEMHISKFDLQSVMLMFEEWVKAPLSPSSEIEPTPR